MIVVIFFAEHRRCRIIARIFQIAVDPPHQLFSEFQLSFLLIDTLVGHSRQISAASGRKQREATAFRLARRKTVALQITKTRITVGLSCSEQAAPAAPEAPARVRGPARVPLS